ncbi:MAG: hypothetical protein RLZZ491_2711 [Pseudomonadota bacterium]
MTKISAAIAKAPDQGVFPFLWSKKRTQAWSIDAFGPAGMSAPVKRRQKRIDAVDVVTGGDQGDESAHSFTAGPAVPASG